MSRTLLYSIAPILAAILIASRATAQTDSTAPLLLSLAECWSRADNNNKTIAIRRLSVAATAENVLDAKASRLPDINADANVEKTTPLVIDEDNDLSDHFDHAYVRTHYKLGADTYLNLYNGGHTNLKIEEQQTLHRIAETQDAYSISNIRLDIAADYLDLQKNLVFRDLLLEDINTQQRQLDRIRQNLAHGIVLKSDALRAEVKLSQEKLTLTRINNDITLASQRLAIEIGEPEDRVIVPTRVSDADSIALRSYNDYADAAGDRSYENQLAKEDVALSGIRLKSIKANQSVKLGLYGTFAYAYPETFLYPYYHDPYSLGIAGVKASFPISSFYQNKHKVAAARLDYEQKQIAAKDVGDKVRVNIRQAWLRYQECLEKIAVSQKNVEQSIENQRIVSNTYFNQTSLITDLLDANVQLLQSRFDLVQARTDAQLQYYQLLYVTDKL